MILRPLLIAVILGCLAVVVGVGCKAVSSTQPSPALMLGERIMWGYSQAALNDARTRGEMDYTSYLAASSALKTLFTNAAANGGRITRQDIADAVGAGAFVFIDRNLTKYLPPEPVILPEGK